MGHIGIIGFGPIGRLVFRAAYRRHMKIAAINSSCTTPEHIAYLLKFDTVHGRFHGQVGVEGTKLLVNCKPTQLFNEQFPEKIKWYEADVSYVIDTTNSFNTLQKANRILKNGVERVVVSGKYVDIPIFVCGANLESFESKLKIISPGCPTTNAIAPLAKLIHENFHIKKSFVTSIRATSKPKPVFSNNPTTWRENRTAMCNIIPVSLEHVVKAIGTLLPDLNLNIAASAYQVPVPNCSALDFVVQTEKPVKWDDMLCIIQEASSNDLKGILGYNTHNVVSSDFSDDSNSLTFDVGPSLALDEHFFKLVGWYDNEWAYANRLLDVMLYTILIDAKESLEKDKR